MLTFEVAEPNESDAGEMTRMTGGAKSKNRQQGGASNNIVLLEAESHVQREDRSIICCI